MDTQVGPGTVVELAYRLLDEDGDVVEESTLDDPFSYVHGFGQLFSVVEAALEGKVAGQRCTVKVPMAEAYGERDPEAVFTLDRAELGDPDSIKVEDVLEVEGDDGHVGMLRVVEIVDGGFVVDGNHLLAGQDLSFEVEVADVRPATDEELETAERALEECCDDHDHDHDHPHVAPGLVQLRRRELDRDSRFSRLRGTLSRQPGGQSCGARGPDVGSCPSSGAIAVDTRHPRVIRSRP